MAFFHICYVHNGTVKKIWTQIRFMEVYSKFKKNWKNFKKFEQKFSPLWTFCPSHDHTTKVLGIQRDEMKIGAFPQLILYNHWK